MTQKAKKMKILIGYDGTEGANLALDDLQRAGLPGEADVRVVTVAEPSFLLASISGPMIAGESVIGIGPARTLAEKAVARIRSEFPNWTVGEIVVSGSPAGAMIATADEWKPDLLVIGSHGHSMLGRFFLGSVSQTVIAQAPCTVRVARPNLHKGADDTRSPLRLLVGVDGSHGAENAIRCIASRKWPQGTEARIITGLWLMPPAADEMDLHENEAMRMAEWVHRAKYDAQELVESAAQSLNEAGLITSVLVRQEEPKRLLLLEAESWNADCIFVGARGLGRLERMLMGSVSLAVVTRAHCSVEVVRAC
jgi:nucleotide-binding universal stress UspA family protein